MLVISSIPVLLSYPAFLLVGTYDQYHNLNGQTRETMIAVWKNPYGFGIGLSVAVIFGIAVFLYFTHKIKKESRSSKED